MTPKRHAGKSSKNKRHRHELKHNLKAAERYLMS